MDYVVGRPRRGKGVCVLGGIIGMERPYEIQEGVQLASSWSKDARFKMDDDMPRDTKLEDFLNNLPSVLVVSERVRTFLEAENVKLIEFLPVTILNHKGRPEKAPYFIANCTANQDCIDESKATFKPNAINPDIWISVQNIVLDPKKLDPELKLFRLKRYSTLDVWREDLAKKAMEQGFTGRKFIPLSEFEA
jgi:hypothetical protein